MSKHSLALFIFGFFSLSLLGHSAHAQQKAAKKVVKKAPAKKVAKKAPAKKAAKKALAKKVAKKALAKKVVKKAPAKKVAKKAPAPIYPNVRYDYKPDELIAKCAKVLNRTKEALNKIAAMDTKKQLSFYYTFVPFEVALSEQEDLIEVVYLLKYASPKKEIRRASQVCLRNYFGFMSNLFARADLYKVLQKAAQSGEKLDQVDQKLKEEVLKNFRRSGAAAPPKKSKEIAKLNAKISELSMKFNSNISEIKTTVLMTAKELKGVSKGFLARLKKTKDGRYIIKPRLASHYLEIVRNAVNPQTRKKIVYIRKNLIGDKNSKLLEKILVLRQKLAKLLGYKTYAHYVLADRMAKTPERVFFFLESLRKKLSGKMADELGEMIVLKRQEDKKAYKIDPWDWRYYANKLKKTKYAVDDDKLREYFPIDHVIKSVFAIYQQLLGVTFKEIKPAKAWHPDVRLFSVHDNKTKKLVCHFYLDLYPRPGKYGHFAAFSMIHGRRLQDGLYQTPVSSIVGNWPKPTKNQNSLLSHRGVETFFHEFGHIMHQTLTKARYGTLAGTNVKLDFVEAPSQMLENWVWSPSILKKISKHYKTGKPLPDAMIKKLIASKHATAGLYWTRQILYATIDMTYHTTVDKNIDTAKLWEQIVKKVMPVAYTPNTKPAGTFGHLIGYGAGYYGYLWSKVFAQDMFSLFKKYGLLSQKIGMRYRKWILEPGGTMDPNKLIEGFLGRKPKFDAFYEELGIK